MKDVPGWKVKTGSLLCHVRNEDAWINYFTHFVREPFVQAYSISNLGQTLLFRLLVVCVVEAAGLEESWMQPVCFTSCKNYLSVSGKEKKV